MKHKIGVSVIGKDNAIGPTYVIMVVANNQFFRKHAYALRNVTDDKLESVYKRAKENLEFMYVITINPQDHETQEKFLVEVDKAIMSALNTYIKFWEHDIEILHWAPDLFKLTARMYASHNLRSHSMNLDKWKIHQEPISKILQLANHIGRRYFMINKNQNLEIYGDYGEGTLDDPKTLEFIKESPKCPQIRKYINNKLEVQQNE